MNICGNRMNTSVISCVDKRSLITRRNWVYIGDVKIRGNYLTNYPFVFDKRFYSISFFKRKPAAR